LIVGEELEAANFLIRPGLAPGHALQAFDARQNLCPSFVITLQSRMENPTAVEVERAWPRLRDFMFTPDDGRVLCNKAQRMFTFGREDFYQQFATADRTGPADLGLCDIAVEGRAGGQRRVMGIAGPAVRFCGPWHGAEDGRCQKRQQANNSKQFRGSHEYSVRVSSFDVDLFNPGPPITDRQFRSYPAKPYPPNQIRCGTPLPRTSTADVAPLSSGDAAFLRWSL